MRGPRELTDWTHLALCRLQDLDSCPEFTAESLNNGHLTIAGMREGLSLHMPMSDFTNSQWIADTIGMIIMQFHSPMMIAVNNYF